MEDGRVNEQNVFVTNGGSSPEKRSNKLVRNIARVNTEKLAL